jgi:myo-inositol-1(or 4)-monophosphatase
MNEHIAWLDTAISIARDAGRLLRERWRTGHTVRSKGYRNIVTEADEDAEALILGRLREVFPDHALTSEEAGAESRETQVRWLVDPLDGTTNFSRNNPNFGVSIAAVEGNEPLVGVVYDPLRDLCFAARRGDGATLNGDPLRTSGMTRLERMIFSADWPRERPRRSAAWALAGTLISEARTLRCLGSAALNMAYVAAGWFDLYMGLQLSPWDQAAAALLVREAGGAVGTVSGAPWTPDAPDPLMAATPALLDLFWSVVEGGQVP